MKNANEREYELELYTEMTKSLASKVEIEAIEQLSKDLSEKIIQYKHCKYQCAISAVILSHNDPFLIVICPTGSGKTWIQGLIAKYYCE